MRRCPWFGKECDCAAFPWLRDEVVPPECEDGAPIEMSPHRRVSAAMRERYKLYLVPCKKCRKRFEKTTAGATTCPACG